MARFYRRGVSKIYWFAGTDTAPIAADDAIDTGAVDLTPDIAEMTGFTLTSGLIPTPDLSTRYTKSIPGEDTTPESSFTFYDRDDATTIRDALAKDAIGYITLLPYGSGSGNRAEVWTVQVIGSNDTWTVANEPARFVVSFAILEVPNQADALT